MRRSLRVCIFAGLFSSCIHDPVVPAQEISFRNDVQPIIAGNCQQSGCHGTTDFKKFQLITYQNVIDNGEIIPGKPHKSKMFEAITGSGEELMPPSGKLSDKQISTIQIWIEQGANDN